MTERKVEGNVTAPEVESIVKFVVEAELVPKDFVPAPVKTTLAKSSVVPIIWPESVIPEPVKYTVPALSVKSPLFE